MPQHDYVISDALPAAIRADINLALGAVATQNAGPSAPAVTYPYMPWPDETEGLYKIRNAANTGWITLFTLGSANGGLLSRAGGTMTGPLVLSNGTPALPSLTFSSGGADTGFYGTGNADEIGAATNGIGRWLLDASGYQIGAVNGLGAGLYQAWQQYRLNAALVNNNVSGAQNYLGVGCALAANTVYEFEIIFALAKTAGTTAHTFALGFGGTATLNNILYHVDYRSSDGGTLPPAAQSAAFTTVLQSASPSVVSGAFTGANATHHALIKGAVSVNAAGTFTPQYTLSAAPGGAYTTQAGSYMKIAPVGPAGVIDRGTWA